MTDLIGIIALFVIPLVLVLSFFSKEESRPAVLPAYPSRDEFLKDLGDKRPRVLNAFGTIYAQHFLIPYSPEDPKFKNIKEAYSLFLSTAKDALKGFYTENPHAIFHAEFPTIQENGSLNPEAEPLFKNFDATFTRAEPYLSQQGIRWIRNFHFTTAILPPIVRIPVHIPEEKWFEGVWVVAPPGRGKTNLLRHLILDRLEGGHRDCSVIIIDAKGELIQTFNRVRGLKDRFIFLDPDLPLAINPLDIGGHSIELLEYIFSSLLEAQMTPLQSTLFRMVLTLLEQVPDANIETFRDIIQNGWKPYEPYVKKLKPRDREFFEKEFNTKGYNERKPEILWRLRLLMTNPSLDAMFQSKQTKIDLSALMDSGKIIFINNNYETLGEQGAEFFGRFFIALIWNAARKRTKVPDAKKKPVYVFIDEAHYVIARDTKVATILQQCRAQKIAMIFSHQELMQIKNEDVRGALSNCAVKFANSTGEAHELARPLNTSPEFLKDQKIGYFACSIRDTQDAAISIPVPLVRDFVDLQLFPMLTDKEMTELHDQMKVRYGIVPAPVYDGSYDLSWEITISPKLAREGGKHRIQGIEVTIPPNTSHGAKLCVRGFGTPRPDGSRGDLYLTVNVPSPHGKENW